MQVEVMSQSSVSQCVVSQGSYQFPNSCNNMYQLPNSCTQYTDSWARELIGTLPVKHKQLVLKEPCLYICIEFI